MQINNGFYDNYGERWYTADDDPVALLRAENKIKTPWVINRIRANHLFNANVLDVACGGGFLSNELSRAGFNVTAIDLSEESLRVAHDHDYTHKVKYEKVDAYHLPYENESFDVVTVMDFLEHVETPASIIKECSRVLKPGGLFFFHTFNRNILSWIVIIKGVEWLVKNTPKNMHVIDLFIKPSEIKSYCENADLTIMEMTGIRPEISSIPLKSIFTGRVSPRFKFTFTENLLLSYMGAARKRLSTGRF